jgi:hypothetical protein
MSEAPMRASRHHVVAVVLVASLLASCTGYKRVTLPASPPAASDVSLQIKVGDVVRIGFADHQQKEFCVTAVERDGLVGAGGQRAAYADIVMLERRTVDKSRTTVLLLSPLIVLGAFIVGCSIANCPF